MQIGDTEPCLVERTARLSGRQWEHGDPGASGSWCHAVVQREAAARPLVTSVSGLGCGEEGPLGTLPGLSFLL